MSRPPKCDCAAAAATRAASGCVRSPAEALAAMPSPANSFTRSASPTAFTSASTSFAPARPKPRATACPICPTRPTPVTSATLPRKSAGMHGRDDVVHGRSAALSVAHRSVASNHVYRALDPAIIVFERAIRAGDRTVWIGEQRKVELHLLHVALVAI